MIGIPTKVLESLGNSPPIDELLARRIDLDQAWGESKPDASKINLTMPITNRPEVVAARAWQEACKIIKLNADGKMSADTAMEELIVLRVIYGDPNGKGPDGIIDAR